MSNHPTPERLSAYLDDELEEPVRAALDEHLGECAECGAYLAELAAVDVAAREVPLSVPERYFEDFAPRVRARLEKKAGVRWRPPVWGWAAAAALLLAVITPLAVRFSQTVAPREGAPAPAAPAEMRAGLEKQQSAATPALAAKPAPPPQTVPPRPRAAPAPASGRGGAGPLADQVRESRLARRDRAAPGFVEREEAARAGTSAPERALPKREIDETAQNAREGSTLDQRSDERPQALGGVGYGAPPPPGTQRQHGPRAQNAPPPELRGARRKSPTESTVSKDNEQGTDSVSKKMADADASGKALQESLAVAAEARDVAPGPASAKFRSLAAGQPPRSDGEARALREAWRAFAAANPDHPQADEARVRLVEAGVLAYSLGRRPQDQVVAERDARAYLERTEAPQAARVRSALKALMSAAP